MNQHAVAEGDFHWQTGKGSLADALALADRLATKSGDELTEAEQAARVLAGFYRREHELRVNNQ